MDISAAALSPDGAFLAVGGCSKPLEEDLRSGNILCDGQDSASPGGVPFLLILDASTEEVIAVIPENEAETAIADLAFTPDGEKLLYAVHPGKFVVWDMNSGEVESILWEEETSAPTIAVSPDGRSAGSQCIATKNLSYMKQAPGTSCYASVCRVIVSMLFLPT
jgi:hypothetical protein